MEKSVVNPSFLKLTEVNPGKDLASIREPLSVLLEGFLKNLKYNRYPVANDFSKAGIFIQNAAFMYSIEVEELFTYVTELNKALCYISLPISNALTPVTPSKNNVSSVPTDDALEGSEESDEQVTSSRAKKQSRKKIEELDCDPVDITDPWTSDNIDELREEEVVEIQSDMLLEQDVEVETVLAQCDNYESTESFIHRDDINKDLSVDIPKREFRILAHMDDEGFICSDFNIFEEKKSKRHNLMTIDLLEGSELMDTIDRDKISLGPESIDNDDARDNDQDESEELGENLQRRLDTNNRDDRLFDIRKFLDYNNSTDMFAVPVMSLEEYAKKYQKRNAVYKYESNRAVNSDKIRLEEALSICSSTSSLEYLDSNKEFLFDPDVKFEGSQLLYDGDWFGWPREEDSENNQNEAQESTPEVVPELDESQFVPEPEKIKKTGVEDINKNLFTKRATKWIEKYKPIVEKSTTRKKFNIREYGDRVIETIESNDEGKDEKTLEDVLGPRTFKEASKYFLALLVLANNGNVSLEKPTSDPLSVNKCNIKLLSHERHHDKLDQDIAVQATVPGKKTKR